MGNVMDKLKPVLAVLAHIVGPKLIAVIKEKALEAALHDEWSPGEKTTFVYNAVREMAAATPSIADDLAVEFAIKYYERKFANRK